MTSEDVRGTTTRWDVLGDTCGLALEYLLLPFDYRVSIPEIAGYSEPLALRRRRRIVTGS